MSPRAAAAGREPPALRGPLPWQATQWRALVAAVQAGRLGHALLLTGPDGTGKRAFADAFAGFLLCEQRGADRACGRCRGCIQIAAGGHPNFGLLTLLEDKSELLVDQVRETIDRVGLTAHYGMSKVVLVTPAHLLNPAAANALLKTLEEPPPATHFLLLTARPRSLPATVRSRSLQLRFPVPPRAQAAAWLAEQGIAADAAAALLDDARGAPLRALAADDDGSAQRHAEWAELMREVGAGTRPPLAAAASLSGPGKPLRRPDAAAFLTFVMEWAVRQIADDPAQAAARGAALEPLWQQALRMLGELAENNASPQLAAESIIIQWSRSPARGRGQVKA